MTQTIEIDQRRIEVSNPDKVLFPDEGTTKGDLADYYERVAAVMFPHVEGRALTLHRYPEGIGDEGFFQKNTPEYFPEWITRKELEKEGGTVHYAVCEEKATLVYLADQACITPHVWLSKVDRVRRPDRMIFDLDPPEDSDDIDRLHRVLRGLRDLLAELELSPFLMTTGSAGYHVLVPLDRSADFDESRAVARALAGALVERLPDATTLEQRKNRREGKIFVDYLRNSYGQTSVAPYAVRARPRVPIATPLHWDELGGSRPQSWNIGNIFRRLGQTEDPWADLPSTTGMDVRDVVERLED